MASDINYSWEQAFPKGYGHTSIAFLKRCYGYEDAKNGDLRAAQFVVNRCVKQSRIRELRNRYPNAVLLPVISRNQLPLALAQVIDLRVWTNAILMNTVSRKSLNSIQRLLHKPFFTGRIIEGHEYILVDDVVTQGGTVAALRKLVIFQGGKVIAVAALAYAIGSHAIAPLKGNLIRLIIKFGYSLAELLHRFNIIKTVYELTNSQVKYLLCFASVKTIEKRLEVSCLLQAERKK